MGTWRLSSICGAWEGGDFFDMYVKSFERVWEVSSPIEESGFWKQRTAAINTAGAARVS